jgi:hypothetical protein
MTMSSMFVAELHELGVSDELAFRLLRMGYTDCSTWLVKKVCAMLERGYVG